MTDESPLTWRDWLRGAVRSVTVWVSAFLIALPDVVSLLQTNFATLKPWIPDVLESRVFNVLGLIFLVLRIKTTVSLPNRGPGLGLAALNPGWRESFGALGALIAIGLLIAVLVALSACSGTRVLAEFEHHSSAQDYYDRATSDQAGIIVAVPLRFRTSHCDRYCPEAEVGLLWEVTGEPVFGRNPIGTLRLRQPLYVRP